MLIMLFVKLGCSFNLEDGVFTKHINCLIKLKGKKGWLCEELEMRKKAFQEDRARRWPRNRRITKNLLCRSGKISTIEI